MTVNWDLLQVAVGVPAVLGALGYCAPQARLRRRVRAFGEIAASLPEGDLRDWYVERVLKFATRLQLYRQEIVEKRSYPVNWLVTALVVGLWINILVDWPETWNWYWRDEWFAGLLAGAATLGAIGFMSGLTNAWGQAPAGIRAEREYEIEALKASIEAWKRERPARLARREEMRTRISAPLRRLMTGLRELARKLWTRLLKACTAVLAKLRRPSAR